MGSPRATEARSRGYWVIREGDDLYNIARQFYPSDPVKLRQLMRELFARNPVAFINGKENLMVVGARLFLPDSLGPKPPAAAPAPPPAAAPAVSSPAASPTPPAGPAASSPAAPEPPPAAATVPARPLAASAYRDQLIDPAASAAQDIVDESRQADESPGRRGWSVGLLHETRKLSGQASVVNNGITLSTYRETEQYGDLVFDGTFGRSEASALDGTRDRDRVRATLYHNNFALTRNLSASTALGVVRSYLPFWLASSYRVNFPTSELAGVTSVVSSPTQEFHASYGDLGRSFGALVQGFERTDGSLASVGMTQRLPGGWQLGAIAIDVQDSLITRDHSALMLAAGREGGKAGDFFKVQGIVDDDSNAGAIVDGQFTIDRWTHRLGAYQLDPLLSFGETTGQADVRGAYWRSEIRSGGNLANFGVEYSANNFERDPLRGGVESAGGYVNAALRLDRTMQVGGGLSLREEKPMVGSAPNRTVSFANAYFSRTGTWGISRLDASYFDSRPRGLPGESVETLSWNQDWPRLLGIESNTYLTLSNERAPEGRTRRTTASLGLRGPVMQDLRWDANVTFVDVDAPEGSERNYNSLLGLDWQFTPSWSLALQWIRNEIQPSAQNDVNIPFRRENTVQLSARWTETRGISYGRLGGGAAARSASGRIEGVVFFDENGDGVQQPTERGAPNVVLLLNGRIPQATDRDGRFAYPLVPSGSYSLTVLPEKVPLPWGLADEAPKSVTVGVRQDARIEIGLTRISP